MIPRFPLDYASAETKHAFSVFVFDDGGRPVSFEKWLMTRTPEPIRGYPAKLAPGTHFFGVSPDGSPRFDQPLTLESTRPPLDSYFRISVDGAGNASAVHVRRELAIHHVYSYWDNGRLREFRSEPAVEPDSVLQFDRNGKAIK